MKEFRFVSFERGTDAVVFRYSCSQGDSVVTLALEKIEDLPDQFIGYIGVALALHAFRIDLFDTIIVEPIPLTKTAQNFFEQYILHGLAEHRYVNNFPLNHPVTIKAKIANPPTLSPAKPTPLKKALLMIGGGKDSLVALELVKKLGIDYDFFVYGTNIPSEHVITQFGDGHKTWRCTMSVQYPQNAQRITGHFPVSAYFAFMSTAVAYLHGYSSVITANEFSANTPTLIHEGFPVNHQYTKSGEFEAAFANLVKAEIFDGDYYSILRPLYEIQIAAIFAHFPQYFPHFISCNHAQKQDPPEWCEECAKCTFVFMILAPFITAAERQSIWSKNLFKNAAICQFALELATAPNNPLECVGTIAESQLALYLCDQAGLLATAHPDYRAQLQAAATLTNIAEHQSLLTDTDRPHHIPSQIWSTLKPLLDTYLQQAH